MTVSERARKINKLVSDLRQERVFRIVLNAITIGAPGLGDPIRRAIAQNIAMRVKAEALDGDGEDKR